jgi:hypothetical protein
LPLDRCVHLSAELQRPQLNLADEHVGKPEPEIDRKLLAALLEHTTELANPPTL